MSLNDTLIPDQTETRIASGLYYTPLEAAQCALDKTKQYVTQNEIDVINLKLEAYFTSGEQYYCLCVITEPEFYE